MPSYEKLFFDLRKTEKICDADFCQNQFVFKIRSLFITVLSMKKTLENLMLVHHNLFLKS